MQLRLQIFPSNPLRPLSKHSIFCSLDPLFCLCKWSLAQEVFFGNCKIFVQIDLRATILDDVSNIEMLLSQSGFFLSHLVFS